MAKGFKTGGRKPGTPNKRKAELAAGAQGGMLPRDFLLRVMRDRKRPIETRIEAAKAAAGFIHPKLQAVMVQSAPAPLNSENIPDLEAAKMIAFTMNEAAQLLKKQRATQPAVAAEPLALPPPMVVREVDRREERAAAAELDAKARDISQRIQEGRPLEKEINPKFVSANINGKRCVVPSGYGSAAEQGWDVGPIQSRAITGRRG